MTSTLSEFQKRARDFHKRFDAIFQEYSDLRYEADMLADEYGLCSDDLLPPMTIVLPPRKVVW